jgi:hypothetical protein
MKPQLEDGECDNVLRDQSDYIPEAEERAERGAIVE